MINRHPFTNCLPVWMSSITKAMVLRNTLLSYKTLLSYPTFAKSDSKKKKINDSSINIGVLLTHA